MFLQFVLPLEAGRVCWAILVWTEVVAIRLVNAFQMAIEVGFFAKRFTVFAVRNGAEFRILVIIPLVASQLLCRLELGLDSAVGQIARMHSREWRLRNTRRPS